MAVSCVSPSSFGLQPRYPLQKPLFLSWSSSFQQQLNLSAISTPSNRTLKNKMEPAWLSYTGRWGPKIAYDFVVELTKAISNLSTKIQDLVMELLHKLPAELLGEQGSVGPKMKQSWKREEI